MSDERARLLRNAAAARSRHAEERTRHSLLALDERGAPITFAAVAAQANVSRQFLYSHRELRAEIDHLRGAQQQAPSPLPVRERASDESLRTRLRATLEDNKRLREELAELRDELALAHGRAREIEQARPAVTPA